MNRQNKKASELLQWPKRESPAVDPLNKATLLRFVVRRMNECSEYFTLLVIRGKWGLTRSRSSLQKRSTDLLIITTIFRTTEPGQGDHRPYLQATIMVVGVLWRLMLLSRNKHHLDLLPDLGFTLQLVSRVVRTVHDGWRLLVASPRPTRSKNGALHCVTTTKKRQSSHRHHRQNPGIAFEGVVPRASWRKSNYKPALSWSHEAIREHMSQQ